MVDNWIGVNIDLKAGWRIVLHVLNSLLIVHRWSVVWIDNHVLPTRTLIRVVKAGAGHMSILFVLAHPQGEWSETRYCYTFVSKKEYITINNICHMFILSYIYSKFHLYIMSVDGSWSVLNQIKLK